MTDSSQDNRRASNDLNDVHAKISADRDAALAPTVMTNRGPSAQRARSFGRASSPKAARTEIAAGRVGEKQALPRLELD